MATFFAFEQINLQFIDFNYYSRNFIDVAFENNVGFPPNDPQFSDTYILYADDVFGELVLFAAGDGFNATATSGTVNYLYEFNLNGPDYWEATGISVSLSAIADVISTPNNADDIALIRDVFSGNDLMQLSMSDDRWSGFVGKDRINGYAGNDTLFGGDGGDTITGGNGFDRINGEGGWDRMFGGNGNDTINGGGGNDTAFGGDGFDRILMGDGFDRASGGGKKDVMFGGRGNDTMFGDNGNDELDMGEGNDLAFGGNGFDRMFLGLGADEGRGGNGNDTIFGGGGNDTLFGGQGNDLLFGGDFADTLIGAAGNDTMWGGRGSDIFEFSDKFGNDVIRDFDTMLDVLTLSASVFDGGSQNLDDYADDSGPDVIYTISANETLILRGVENAEDVDFLVV